MQKTTIHSVAPGETLRLPIIPGGRACLSVVSGRAWLTAGRADIILTPGECWTPDKRRVAVVVSALGGAAAQIVIEG